MKKAIAMLLISCLVLFFLSGCAKKNISSAPVGEEENGKPVFGQKEASEENYPLEEVHEVESSSPSAPPAFPE